MAVATRDAPTEAQKLEPHFEAARRGNNVKRNVFEIPASKINKTDKWLPAACGIPRARNVFTAISIAFTKNRVRKHAKKTH